MKLTGVSEIELTGYRSKNLDTTCYRGSAPLAHLALISQTDVFDQVSNPDGLQRDLSPKHASEAYEYVKRAAEHGYPRAFPEVVLNVRDKRILESTENGQALRMCFNIGGMSGAKVHVSRVDGNHRLYYAKGDDRRTPLLSEVPFQIHIGLTREQERSFSWTLTATRRASTRRIFRSCRAS